MSPQARAAKKHVLKSAGIVSGMTLCSRVLGLVRDILNAHIFGISRVWDAFVFAFMLPNFLRRLLGEGALSGAFIPLYAELLNTKGREQAQKFTNLIISGLVIVLGAVLLFVNGVFIVLMLFMTVPPKVLMIIRLLQVFSPYILILCVVAIMIGVLNCHKKFFVPSLMPIMLNIGWIGALIFLCSVIGETLEEKAYVLATSIFIVGIFQFILQLIALRKTGYQFEFTTQFSHPYFSRLITLMLPAVLGFSVMQINILVDLFLGFLIGDGANSSLWYGNRLMQFPLGMFGIAMGTVLLPTISHQIAQKNYEEMKETLSFSLRAVFLVIIPSTVGLIVLREPIVALLFKGGMFDQRAVVKAANTLMAYSLGLFAYSGLKLLLPTFYSLKDTKTPMKIGVLCMVLNITLNLILMVFLKEVGIALSTSITNAINFFILFMLLERKVGSVRGLITPLVKMCVASVAMGAFVWWGAQAFVCTYFASAKLNLCVVTLGSVVFGCCVYVGVCALLRLEELYKAIDLIKVRVKKHNEKVTA